MSLGDIELVMEDLDKLVEIARENYTIAGYLGVVNSANFIIKTLEKQIPKKPLFKTDYSAYSSYYVCPSCGALAAEHMNYCSGNRDYGEPSERGCGQKLDWN